MSPLYADRAMDMNHTAPEKRRKRHGATRLSCAECRRLKLKCDRNIPCGSCVKRGCGAICPDGSLTTGQGNRFVLASTQELHEKISELCIRIRELEDALRESHMQHTTEQHPLLTPELLQIKAPLQREAPAFRNAQSNAVKEEESNPDVVDAFGSLSLGQGGQAKYYGGIANSVFFLSNELPEDEVNSAYGEMQKLLPMEILELASALPVSPASGPHSTHDKHVGIDDLLCFLPLPQRMLELRASYYTYAAWMYNPISSEWLNNEICTQFYDPAVQAQLTDDRTVSQRLSLMFLVLAIGSLMEMSSQAYNVDAEKYHQLARAALFRYSFFDDPSITAVQALYLMTFYLFLADRHGTKSGARWAIMGLAVKVGQSIGLHRDYGRFKKDTTETQRRRELFWEMFTYDSWQCLTFGRPPSFALPHIDCKVPFADPTDEQCFHAWKHRFTSECMNLLHDQAFGAKMPTYATVLSLDRKMRAFPVPPILQVAGFGNSEPRSGGYPETVMLTLQRHIVLAIRETNLLYLHRSFFARAVSDHPKDPLGSPYGTSVIAAYRSAGSLIALMRNLHSQLKEPTERMWFLWTHMFSCAIVLGSIVTRCPSMSVAPSALLQLDSACELFSKAAGGFHAEKVLEIMLKLRERAHISLNDFKNGNASPIGRLMGVQEPNSPENDNDELSMLGGKTRLVEEKPGPPTPQTWSPTSGGPVVPFPVSFGEMDSNLRSYLGTFSRGHDISVPEQLQQQPPQQPQLHQGQSSAGPDIQVTQDYMYNMTGYQSFSADPVPRFNQQHQQQHAQVQQYSPSRSQHQQQPLGLMVDQQQHSHIGASSVTSTSSANTAPSIPQYFPVFDYSMNVPPGVFAPSPISNSSNFSGGGNINGSPARNSGTPEETMDSAWYEFVQTFTGRTNS
ncbi:hypothetical protein AX16_001386 [Volvariella volvacea WC 439]|nr:hypothetical protein AX16_001386 [Volvariella volvacea WC 439]